VKVNDPSDPVAIRYALHSYEKQLFDPLGTAAKPIYRPHELLSNPPRPEDITLELLLASGAHLGHATQLWHPGNSQYIFGVRGVESGDPIHIISLDVTAAYLRRACKVVEAVAENGGVILFVGTRNGQARVTVKAASMAKGCHLFSKWTPGSITNAQQILGKCAKKVVNKTDEEMDGFDDQLNDYAAIKPDLVVCLNPVENYVLLRECGQHGIPTIGIVDTDCNPTWVTYPIPANDDSPRCVQVLAGALGRAGEAGHKKRLARGVLTYKARHSLTAPKRGTRPKKQSAGSSAAASSKDHEVDIERDLRGVPVDQFERDQELFAMLGGKLEEATQPSELDFASEEAQDAAAEAFSLEDNEETARIIAEVQQSESGSTAGSVKTSSSASQSVQEDDVELDIREEDYVQLQGRSGQATESPEASAEESKDSEPATLSKGEIEALIQAEVAKRTAAHASKKKATSKKSAAAEPVAAPPKQFDFDTSEFDLVSGFDVDPAAPVVSQAPEKQSPTIAAASSWSPPASSKPLEEKEQTPAPAAKEAKQETASASPKVALSEEAPAAEEPVTEAVATPTPANEPVVAQETKQEESIEQPQGTVEFASDQVAAAQSAPTQPEPAQDQQNTDATPENADQSQGTVEFASDQVVAEQSTPAPEPSPAEQEVASQSADETVKEASTAAKDETAAAAIKTKASDPEVEQSTDAKAKEEKK
jgi:ribosomal protein S2